VSSEPRSAPPSSSYLPESRAHAGGRAVSQSVSADPPLREQGRRGEGG
jgi:hypothetical protein